MTNDYPRTEPKEGSQSAEIIKYLETGKTLTPLDALRLMGTFKLSTRCGELRQAGYDIKSEWIRLGNGKRIKQYHIDNPKQCVILKS